MAGTPTPFQWTLANRYDPELWEGALSQFKSLL
jgi:hypothetical protein